MRAEDAHLLAVFQLGLEADHVEERAERVVLAQLHDRIGLRRRPVRIGQAERLHRPVAQRLAPALGHHLDRQAAVEIGRRRFPVLELGLLAGEQRVDEGVVLLARQRAIDVVGAGAAGAGLVVARLEPGDVDSRWCRDARSARWRRRRRARPRRCSARIAAARAGEVSGPVATMTLSQSAGGSARLLRASIVDQRMRLRAPP